MKETCHDLREVDRLLTENGPFVAASICAVYICGVFGATLLPLRQCGHCHQATPLSYTPCLQLLNGLDHFDDEVYVNYHLFIDLAFFGNRHELNRIALA